MQNQSLYEFNRTVLAPGLRALEALGGPALSNAAFRILLAIARQEGGPHLSRYQVLTGGGKGPARGAWQFERAGGVHGVMYHPVSTHLARDLCTAHGLAWNERVIHPALEHDDALAAGFARLLLLTDPHAIPTEEAAAWQCYLRLWRPGKPHPNQWAANWREACQAC